MDHITALPAGTRLQEYTLRSGLGMGGFGITYRADDTKFWRGSAGWGAAVQESDFDSDAGLCTA